MTGRRKLAWAVLVGFLFAAGGLVARVWFGPALFASFATAFMVAWALDEVTR